MHQSLPSLAINDQTASHRIVGKSRVFGNGILCYCRRDQISYLLTQARREDPTAQVRVEPHNAELMGKALRSTDVEWIVNDQGELGVKIGDQFFFMYKAESFMYGNSDAPAAATKYRPVGKREFGESGPISEEVFSEDKESWLTMDHTYQNNEVAYFE